MIRDLTSLLALFTFGSVFMFWATFAASLKEPAQQPQFAQVEASQ